VKAGSRPNTRSRASTITLASSAFRRLPFGVRFAVIVLVVFAVVAAQHVLGR